MFHSAITVSAANTVNRSFSLGIVQQCSRIILGACLLLVLSVMESSAAEIVEGAEFVAKTESIIRNIDTKAFAAAIQSESDLVIIDVREAAEIAQTGGTIDAPRVHNISRGWLEFRVPERVQDKNTPIVVYCGLNLRSPLAAAKLTEMGYTDVRNYEDGFPAWVEAGLPVDSDSAPGNMLYRKPVQVTDNVWSAIGATAPPSYENSGHNNNLSFIITSEGVVVINAGDNYLLAQSLHREIRKLTDLPVKYVVLENGQGHAMLGSNYWQERGAQIIAHIDTATEIQEAGEEILNRMQTGRRDKSMGSALITPDITFEKEYVIELGGERIEVLHLGPAHSPGDISVWLPAQKLVIAGDIAFHERLLPVMEHTDTAGWIETWAAFVDLGAEIVIPGHGGPTNYIEVTRYTHDYLTAVRDQIAALIEQGGTLHDAYEIDQSGYDHLDTYFELARQNAGRIFREMEFDF